MRRLICLFMLLATARLATAEVSAEWLSRAEKLQRDTPTASRALGFQEMRRAAGQMMDIPAAVASVPQNAPQRSAAIESICWRMMPVATDQRKSFESAIGALAQADPKDPWVVVFRLHAAASADDRAALLAAARTLADVPAAFPSSAAEKAHFDLLKELGADDNQAGLEVLSHRSYAPLRALLELDRALTRESDFLQGTTRAADAKLLQTCRDRLRQAWLDASRHLVERLFALHALGREQDCDALLFAARDLPYLTDASEMKRALARLDHQQAWTLLVEPLLESEIQVIKSPPKLPVSDRPAAATLVIEARNKAVQNSIATYEGAVHIQAGTMQLACDKLAAIGDLAGAPKVLSGAGNVSIRGAAGFSGAIECDNFSFNTDSGAFSLGGNVRLKQGDRNLRFRACTVGRTGEVRDSVSLLDDFDAAADVHARLALLPEITGTYSDDQLPPEVRYLLALSLLRPHFVWRVSDTAAGNDTLEPFLRQDAQAQLQKDRGQGANSNRVETILQDHLASNFAWSLKDPSHPDIGRAKNLLAGLSATSYGKLAQNWLAEMGQ